MPPSKTTTRSRVACRKSRMRRQTLPRSCQGSDLYPVGVRRIALALALACLGAPSAARAVDLPAGTARLASGELHAGSVGEAIRVDVALDQDPGDSALRVALPAEVDRVGGTPRLTDTANGRVDLDDAGRSVTLDLGAARAGDDATLAIGTRGLPAGTYDLPLRWIAPDGSSRAAGTLHADIEAGEREGPEGPGWNRVGELRLEQNASSDSAEESETFDVVGPYDSDRLMTAANKGGDLSGGMFLSNDAGRTFGEVHFSTALAVPGGGVQAPSQLSGDPILAEDDLGNIWAGGLTVANCSAGFAS